jgi:hypothetical protein
MIGLLVGPRGSGWKKAVGVLLGVGLLVSCLSRAGAAEQEVRDFTIYVDGSPSGDYHQTITKQDDGSISLEAHSNVKVKFLLITAYSYAYNAVEVWKAGRLQRFESNGKENSKPFAITAQAAENALRVQANGQDRTLPGNAWTTSCWLLPPKEARNKAIVLMGCDNGDQIDGSLQYVGSEQLNVAGQQITCAHYQVMKPIRHDIWYDSSDRMVRDVWMSDGHHTDVALTGIRH